MDESSRLSEFQVNSARPDAYLIPANSLKAGKQYNINVEVKLSEVCASANCIISVKSSDWIILLSRFSDSISLKSDFFIDCDLQDPDDKNTVINKKCFFLLRKMENAKIRMGKFWFWNKLSAWWRLKKLFEEQSEV